MKNSTATPPPLACGTSLLLLLCFVSTTAWSQQGRIPDSQAAAHIGEQAAVEGRIANVFTSRHGKTFLYFGAAYPNQSFSAAVLTSDVRRFGNLTALIGKHVLVTGVVRLKQGKPEIALDDPSQLAVLP